MLVQIFVIVLFSQLANFQPTVEDCPDSQARDKFLQVLDDKCYYFNLGQKLHFTDAQGVCESEGGNLVVVKSKKINDFLKQELTTTYKDDMQSKRVWIGLNDLVNEGVFVWVDGSPLNYTNFGAAQGPKAHILYLFRLREDCVAMDAVTGEWWDYRCESTLFRFEAHRPFICEFKSNYNSTAPSATSTPKMIGTTSM